MFILLLSLLVVAATLLTAQSAVAIRWGVTTVAHRADRAVSAVLAVPAALAGRYGEGAAPLPDGYDPRLHRVFYPATGEIVCRERAARVFVGFRNRLWSNARRYWGDPRREPFATMLPADWAASVEEYDWRRYMARR